MSSRTALKQRMRRVETRIAARRARIRISEAALSDSLASQNTSWLLPIAGLASGFFAGATARGVNMQPLERLRKIAGSGLRLAAAVAAHPLILAWIGTSVRPGNAPNTGDHP